MWTCLAYHTGGSDGFSLPDINLESNYIDGISLTHGPQNSRQHIWSFVNAVGEVGNYQTVWLCDCSNGDAWPHSTGIVGNNYFCDTGNHNAVWSSAITYPDDPLWDGEGCGPSSTCCQFNNPPWFSVSLPQPTSDDLEGQKLSNQSQCRRSSCSPLFPWSVAMHYHCCSHRATLTDSCQPPPQHSQRTRYAAWNFGVHV